MNPDEFADNNVKTVSLSDALAQRLASMKKGVVLEAGDDAPHSRAKWVEATRQMLGLDQKGNPYTFGRINGLTKSWTVEAIRDRFYLCQKMSKPAMYWWYLRKQDAAKKPL